MKKRLLSFTCNDINLKVVMTTSFSANINYYNYLFIYFQASASKNALCQTPTAKKGKWSWKFNPQQNAGSQYVTSFTKGLRTLKPNSHRRLQIHLGFVQWKKSLSILRFNIQERGRFSSHTIYTYVEHLPLNPFFFHNIKVIVVAKDESPLVIVNWWQVYAGNQNSEMCFSVVIWCYQKFVASSVPRPSLFYLRSKNYILMAVSHSFKIFQRTSTKCIFHTLCNISFTVEISEEKKNCIQDNFINFSMLINRQIRHWVLSRKDGNEVKKF